MYDLREIGGKLEKESEAEYSSERNRAETLM